MGEHETSGRPAAKPRDPFLAFLGGCAAVAAVIVVLVLGCGWYVGRRLTRDPAPGRRPEAFLTGAETRYWCLSLRPEDAGLQELFRRVDTMGAEAREKALHGTFLQAFPIPRRHADLAELAPFTLEGSIFTEPSGWAARGTFSHQVLRMRAALSVMRWVMTRKTNKAMESEIDGVTVTEVHDNGVGFALANVGNRVLAASDTSRMREVLGAAAEAPQPTMSALHRAIALEGEDGWAFIAGSRIGSLPNSFSIAAAAASLDVAPGDELKFRVAVSEAAAQPEGRAFRGSVEECGAVIAAILPMFAAGELEIDAGGAQLPTDGARVFTGSVRGLTQRLTNLPRRMRDVLRSPSASPSPPSPPSSGDPRIDIPAVPMREGSPKPPR